MINVCVCCGKELDTSGRIVWEANTGEIFCSSICRDESIGGYVQWLDDQDGSALVGNPEMVDVVEVEMTCGVSPTQWEGVWHK